MRRRYTAICDWVSDLASDSDEIQVRAKSAGGAASAARRVWRETKGAKGNCRLERVWILTRRRLREFA